MYVFIEWSVTNFSMENYIPLALFYCDYSLKLMKKKTLASHGVPMHTYATEVRISFYISFKQWSK